MNKCAECKVKFKNGARKIGCGFCGKWFHVDGNCTDINLQLYELLTKEDQLHWYCKSCNEIAPEVLGSLRKCIEENVQIRKTQEAMKTGQSMGIAGHCSMQNYFATIKAIVPGTLLEYQSKCARIQLNG